MIVFWVLLGLVVIAVIWAVVVSQSGKPATSTPVFTPPPQPTYDPPEDREWNRAQDWQDGPKTSVGKNFGKGGIPTGVASDPGGFAVASKSSYDDDLDMLKKARPFQPRSMNWDKESSDN